MARIGASPSRGSRKEGRSFGKSEHSGKERVQIIVVLRAIRIFCGTSRVVQIGANTQVRSLRCRSEVARKSRCWHRQMVRSGVQFPFSWLGLICRTTAGGPLKRVRTCRRGSASFESGGSWGP